MTDPRLQLYHRGYHDLVSVAPPGAPIAQGSGLNPDDLGKRPAMRGAQGLWYGYSWPNHAPTEADVRRWIEWGANVGLRGDMFPALDIDSMDPALTEFVRNLAFKILGAAPVRSRGGAPKELLVYRTDAPFGRMALRIDEHLIEMLPQGRQYLVYGTHPNGTDYHWLKTPLWEVDPSRLTLVDAERVEIFFDELEKWFDDSGRDIVRIGSGRTADEAPAQDGLLAPSIAALTDVVTAIPNDSRFDDRQEYITMGHAIKAAGAEDEEAAYGLFLEWAMRWENGDNDPEMVRADWRRMRPPYRVGYSWLTEQAGSKHLPALFLFPTNPNAVSQPDLTYDDEGVPVELTHDWLAKQILPEVSPKIRYDYPASHWHVWDGSRWAHDQVGEHVEIIKGAIRRLASRLRARARMLGEKQQRRYLQMVDALGQQAVLNAVINMLETERGIVVGIDAFDTEEMELNTPDGIVDLATGTMLPHDPSKLHSKVTSVSPGGDCPRWKRFIHEVSGGDEELARFLQKTCGYALTGVRKEQTLNFVWGPGGNGKSVFLNVVMDIMHEYAKTAPMDTFAQTRGDKHPTDMAGLMGARLVSASETQAGRSWDEQRIKAITGGDKISARFMRQDFIEFTPRFKLILVGNHEPQIDNVDDAMKRRIHIVPFTFKPDEPDLDLPDKLAEEHAGILQWMIEGCLMWQTEGLQPPEAVIARTQQYFDEENLLGAWLKDCTEPSEDGDELELVAAYTSWANYCRARGEDVGTAGELQRKLRSTDTGLKGLRLRTIKDNMKMEVK